MSHLQPDGSDTYCQTQPWLSLITVVYNGVAHLEQCINSVIANRLPGMEYLIIDGGSTDGTVELIRQYSDQVDYWCSEPDEGISDAFNKGIRQCQGTYVGFLNADDWLEPGCTKILQASVGQADVLYGDMVVHFSQQHIRRSANHHNLSWRMSLNHPSTYIRRELLLQLNGFSKDYKLAMDFELLLRCLHSGASFKHLPHVFAHMRMQGLSARHWQQALQEVYRAKQTHQPNFIRNRLAYWLQYAITAQSLWRKKGR